MGVKNLDTFSTAKALEIYVSLWGIILLVPIFLPDQDQDIRELIRSKREPMEVQYFLRMGEALIILCSFVTCFLLFLKSGNCVFPFGEYLYGVMASCIFLGGLGVLVYAFIDNLPVAYMVPILYYVLCYGGGEKYLGKFFLFSMLDGTVEDKVYLFLGGVVMILAGILIRKNVVEKLGRWM